MEPDCSFVGRGVGKTEHCREQFGSVAIRQAESLPLQPTQIRNILQPSEDWVPG
jgi:hypothetical protein